MWIKLLKYGTARYVSFVLQFLTVIMAGKYLNLNEMGLFGTYILVLNIASQLNLGISQAAHNIMARTPSLGGRNTGLDYTSIAALIALGFLISGVLVLFIEYDILFLGHLKQWVWLLVVTIICTLVIQGGINIYRINADFTQIGFSQSILPVVLFAIVVIFRDNARLLSFLFLGYAVSSVVNVIVIFYNYPKRKFVINISLIGPLLTAGFYLFIYNFSFYSIMLLTRSNAANKLSVDQFGIFTFIFTLGNLTYVLIQAIVYLFVPKMVNVLSSGDLDKAGKSMIEMRNIFLSLLFIGNVALFIAVNSLIGYFEKYAPGLHLLVAVMFSIYIYGFSFGTSTLLIARRKEKMLALMAFLALGLTGLLTILLPTSSEFNYFLIPSIIGNVVYVIMLSFYVNKLYNKDQLIVVFKKLFPYSFAVPSVVFGFAAVSEYRLQYALAALALFFLFNRATIIVQFRQIRRLFFVDLTIK